MGLKDFENLKVGALPVSGWAPPSVGWGWGGRRLVSGFILIDSKPHVFQRILPSKQTFLGSLIPITEWILAGSSLLYQFARHFHLLRRSSCSSTSKWQTQEGWRKSFRECLQMPYRLRGGEGVRGTGVREGTHFSQAVQSYPSLPRRSNGSLKDLSHKERN